MQQVSDTMLVRNSKPLCCRLLGKRKCELENLAHPDWHNQCLCSLLFEPDYPFVYERDLQPKRSRTWRRHNYVVHSYSLSRAKILWQRRPPSFKERRFITLRRQPMIRNKDLIHEPSISPLRLPGRMTGIL